MDKVKPTSLFREASLASLATLFSRILGYLRDAAVAYFFGGGLLTDAFYAAYRIPNLLRRLLGEGAMAAAFIPVFAKSLEEKNGYKENSQRFLSAALCALLWILIPLVLLGVLFTPQITHLIAHGFFKQNPEKFALTVSLSRVMFPYLLFVSLAAMATAILNTLRRFFLPGISPAALSLSEILFVAGAFLFWKGEGLPIIGLAWAVVAGGLLHLAIQIPGIFSKGFSFIPRPDFSHPGLLQVGKLLLPSMLGLSVDQINSFVDGICASFLVEGSMTALYNSNRVMQLPLALFGIAVASAALPSMAKNAAQGNREELKETLSVSLRMVIFALAPAMMGLLILSSPIIQALFERGEFSVAATRLTASSLFCYSLGLVAFAAAKVTASAFYALSDTKTPVRIAVICMILNSALNLLLMGPLGVGGLALSTSIAAWANAGLLLWHLRKKIGGFGGRRILQTFSKSLTASLGMGGLLMLMRLISWPNAVVQTVLSVAVGALLYLAFVRWMKLEEFSLLRKTLSQISDSD